MCQLLLKLSCSIVIVCIGHHEFCLLFIETWWHSMHVCEWLVFGILWLCSANLNARPVVRPWSLCICSLFAHIHKYARYSCHSRMSATTWATSVDFRMTYFVPTFYWIFGLCDANLLEFLFHVFILPMISGIGKKKTSIDITDLIFLEGSFIPQVVIQLEEGEYSITILPSLVAMIGFLLNTNLSRSCLLVRIGV